MENFYLKLSGWEYRNEGYGGKDGNYIRSFNDDNKSKFEMPKKKLCDFRNNNELMLNIFVNVAKN